MRIKLYKSYLLTLLVASMLMLFPKLAHTAIYFVSPSGSASWSTCTDVNTPCSPQTAMANAVADDVVYFRGGTYNVEAYCSGTWELPAMRPAHGGTAGHPITFIAYPGETPIVTPCTTNRISPAFGARDVDYIIWDGFSGTVLNNSVDNEVWYFVYWNSNHSIVRNMNFGAVGGNTTYRNNSPIRIEQTAYAEIYNNYLHDNTGNASATNTCGIWIFSSQYAKVHNNTLVNSQRGICQKDTPNIANEIYKNFIHNTRAYGIGLGENCPTNCVGGSMIYQNILVNTTGIYLGAGGAQYHPNLKIYNNTIYGNSANGIYLDSRSFNASIWNNIIYGQGNPFLRYDPSDFPLYSDYNNFYEVSSRYWNIGWTIQSSSLSSWQSYTTGLDANSITTDPTFINAGGTSPADYKRASYPTNGRGGSSASVMGAYITGEEKIGYLPPSKNFR